MSGPGDPPEGIPDKNSGGGEEEYRSVVFDESFVRAAPLQEFSAYERIRDHSPAVRRRTGRGLPRQLIILVVLIAVAFGTAIYMGVNPPDAEPPVARRQDPLRMTVIPLVPQKAVPGAVRPSALYDNSPAAQFSEGAAGINLPAVRATGHYSQSQVLSALTTAKDYLVESSLDPQVLGGRTVRPVRMLLDSHQHDQFDDSFDRPAADGRHAPTGWLVRFDPADARLADPKVPVRVRGTLRVAESGGTLEVTSDHTFVYALRPASKDNHSRASLLTVRREMHFRFDRADLRKHQTQLTFSYLQAGPLACTSDSASHLRPLLAGEKAKAGGPTAGTDPYAPGGATALCGSLSVSAQPSPPVRTHHSGSGR
ncbi:SCO2583 family membrane protein [Streptomyces tsukubensis]|uniref:Uncharacterized protein n=1 Tax=Streptomyces tsukubensis TaxID=83656 RepID=A0A1V4AAZ3_9ACTN|nr:hypothetical protein [Streptomyces tsukubensis]OON80818.1 hypothetical protein B1H18_10505 [Streptomyces tsukubensis]QFR93542.1 hypothetical protein GBW32_11160 [Streptomyces tsukubensis]